MSSSGAGGGQYVTLTPRCGKEPITLDWIQIDEPAFLFDIPVDILLEQFKGVLLDADADKTWSNDYDRFEVFHFKAEQAIKSVVDHSIPRVKNGSACNAVCENIGPQAEQRYDDWEEAAEAWLREWVKLYNSNLEYHTESEVQHLENAVTDALAKESITAELVTAAVQDFLHHNENSSPSRE